MTDEKVKQILSTAIKALHNVAAAFAVVDRGPHWEENTRAMLGAALACVYEAAKQVDDNERQSGRYVQ